MPQNNPSEQNTSDFTLKNLPKPQRIAVVFLFILAILVVIFWVFQMRSHINNPFDYGDTNKNDIEADSIKALSSNDIDKDGLSDYDEIYVYKTSPYLDDSDSDGLTDVQEVNQGSDPNCPQGKDCNATDVLPNTTGNIDNILGDTATSSLNASSMEEAALQQALSGNIDAASLRQLLIASGADKAVLDQISDEDLMKSYQETLANQELTTQSQ